MVFGRVGPQYLQLKGSGKGNNLQYAFEGEGSGVAVRLGNV